MVTTVYLLACAFALAQPAPADSSDWQLLPRLMRGQELVYRGTYSEAAGGAGVEFLRNYRLEHRIFVLDATPQGADIASLTVWKARAGFGAAGNGPEINSARLEVGQVDRQGHTHGGPGVSWLAPVDGPPTIECGAFVEAPGRRLGVAESWEVAEPGRPPRTWRVDGVALVNNVRCIKLVGQQQSEDWDKPRADHTAWRRSDVVWMTPRGGYAAKVERTIERRDPARSEPNHRITVKYELDSSIQYPVQLFEDRRREINQIQSMADAVTPLLPRAAEVGPRPFEAVLARIKRFVDSQPPTPYRDAIRHVQLLAEAGKRGETPPTAPSGDESPLSPVAAFGRPAPDFLAQNLATRESARLRHWLGQPILLVFYSPASPLGEEVLRFAQKLSDAHPKQMAVVGLAITDDAERALKQRAELNLSFPILSGTGLRQSYGVDATPKLVVLDAAGIVRGSYTGWGPETPTSVTEDLQRSLAPAGK